jgi:hypothetical protein
MVARASLMRCGIFDVSIFSYIIQIIGDTRHLEVDARLWIKSDIIKLLTGWVMVVHEMPEERWDVQHSISFFC